MKKYFLGCATAITLLSTGVSLSAQAAPLSNKECHTQFEAARKAGTLNGLKFKDFKAKNCENPTTSEESAAATTPAAAAAADAPAATSKPTDTATTAGVTFPTAISPKYTKESAGKARMHTCLDQYRLNKATNANGTLKWIQKGGGYYSQCVKKLKGTA
ncbi:hypothetical protein [Entomobacter blattae]|uniref:Uncharacterized protein n=1 Tax=Entomobacter blattae TaxID=2762277 RepID=A0A7H1NQU8_9PROT|nr:hypothetical protein [Entomobacter blattae]QNT78158.1 hypothetical protein JGUZn3_09260 [Entomobacter blattae]